MATGGKFNKTKYTMNYNKKYYKRLHLDFDLRKDKDILSFLETVPSKKAFICEAIREKMADD